MYMKYTNVALKEAELPSPSTAPSAVGTPHSAVLSLETRRRLVLESRARAFKVARRMLLSMGVVLSPTEAQSVADTALLEAASRYREVQGAQFFTYSFYFIKAEVRKVVKLERQSRRELEGNDSRAVGQDGGEGESPLNRVASEDALPDKVIELNHVRLLGFNAPGLLSDLERSLMRGVYVMDKSTEDVGLELGYSRGHAYALRKSAERKLRDYLREN
jgi:DNA-directed RNA polymerase specialized sigma subunit